MMGRCCFSRRCVSKQNATRHLVGPRAIADDVLLVRCAHRHGGGRWQASRRIRACPVRQLSPFQTTSGSAASLHRCIAHVRAQNSTAHPSRPTCSTRRPCCFLACYRRPLSRLHLCCARCVCQFALSSTPKASPSNTTSPFTTKHVGHHPHLPHPDRPRAPPPSCLYSSPRRRLSQLHLPWARSTTLSIRQPCRRRPQRSTPSCDSSYTTTSTTAL
jgi:hypothetical protein